MNPLPFPTAYRAWPDDYKPPWMKISGMENYHDLMVWTWQGSACALTALKCGRSNSGESHGSFCHNKTIGEKSRSRWQSALFSDTTDVV
ncbi:MAG: hypothetical protein AB9903_04295 [Vulcanimicrobiota bacterium]